MPDSELVAIHGETTGVQGWRGFNRITTDFTLKKYLESLRGRDGSAHPLAGTVTSVPEGRVLVAGVVSIGCDIPSGAILVDVGGRFELQPTGMPQPPRPECVVAVITVAVVSAPVDAVPPGSVGLGRMVAFQNEGVGTADLTAVELTDHPDRIRLLDGVESVDLPARGGAERRFAFILFGCQDTAAVLEIADKTITARIDPAPQQVLCSAAERYLAVFDVPSDLIPAAARLATR